MATNGVEPVKSELTVSGENMSVLASKDSKEKDHEDDNELALRGIKLLLNNSWPDSVALFNKYKEQSALMHFGSAFVSYMQAMMSLEDDKMAAAKKTLEEVEKRCRVSKGILKRFRKKMKGGHQSEQETVSQEDKWMSLIIVADSILYQAVLVFIHQDIPSYIKGGWLLRKAWKIYEKTYADINKYYKASKRSGKTSVHVDMETHLDDDDEEEPGRDKKKAPSKTIPKSQSAPGALDESGTPIVEMMSRDTLARLLGAVSFGYGLFQLGLSMIPDKVLKLIEFLGFHGDRESGLTALEICSESTDMRSPLAVLSVLWYHTIMKPFFTNELSSTELEETSTVVDKYSEFYPESALFLFFRGRLCRLQRDLDSALSHYNNAKEFAAQEKELRNAALFEISWVNMMKLNHQVALEGFATLLIDSKWSQCFYTYIHTLCNGSVGNIDDAIKAMKTVPGLMKKKTTQIEAFAGRRAQQFKKTKLTQEICQLLILELEYVWNSINQLSESEVERSLAICANVDDKSFFHLRSLLEGALLRLQGESDFSEQCFKEAVARQEGMKHDRHVATHAYYELAMHYMNKPGQEDEARKYLLKARDTYKEYDFENRLSVRIRNSLRQLEPPKQSS